MTAEILAEEVVKAYFDMNEASASTLNGQVGEVVDSMDIDVPDTTTSAPALRIK